MANGQYNFSIGLNTQRLEVDAKRATDVFKKLKLDVERLGKDVDTSFNAPLQTAPSKVEAATRSFNGLNVATQQLVRELPAASMGMNTLFMALSNNIPIFADQVRNLREKGESVGDIMSNIGKSLFSWQTALVAGVTILSMYGKEIGNWVVSLFKGKEAINASKEAIRTLNETIKENGLGIGDSFVKLRQLSREYRSLGDDINARTQFILDNKSAFDDLGVAINSVVDADRLLIERTPDFVQAMMLRAQASAAKRLAEEKYEEFFIKQQEYIDERDAGVSLGDRFNAYASGLDQSAATGKTAGKIQSAEELYRNRINILKNEAEKVKDVADAYFELSAAKNLEATTTLRNAGISEAAAAAKKAEGKTLQEISDEVFGTEAQQEAAVNKAFEKMRKDLAESRAKSIEDLEQYYIDYGTYQERILATTQRYSRLIAEAENEGQRMALEAEREAILAKFKVEASGFAKSIVEMTSEQLSAMIEQLEAQVDAETEAFQNMGVSDPLKVQAYQAAIAKLTAQIAILKARLGDTEKAVEGDNWADVTQVFQNISKTAMEAANALGDFDSGAGRALKTIAQLSNLSINLISALKGVKKAFDTTTTSINAMEKASAILAVVSVAIQALSMLFSGLKDFQAAEEAFKQTIKLFEQLNDELERTKRLANLASDDNSIFGGNAFGSFESSINVARKALEAYNKTQAELINRGKEVTNVTTAPGTLGVRIDEYSYESLEESLSNMQVLMRDYGKFAESWGARDKYSSLGELLPGLFGEDGTLNMDALKEFQGSDLYEKLSEENRAYIDELIANYEVYEEAMSAMRDYLKGIFGDLGDDMTSALVGAFENGTDAAQAFSDSVSDILARFAADMVKSLYIAPLLAQAQKDIEAIWANSNMSNEDKMTAITERMAQLGRDVSAQQENVNALLDKIDKTSEEQGFDAFGGERRSASKAVTQASQESIDDMNGRLTAIQGHTFNIQADTKRLTEQTTQILRHLAGIETNTQELFAIKQDMRAMRTTLSDIALRGIKTI